MAVPVNDSHRVLQDAIGGLKMVRTDGYLSPFELDDPEWSPDNRDNCEVCDAGFTFLQRRHHCRRCGKVLCNDCAEPRAPLLRLRYNDPVRVCARCCNIARVENTFFTQYLPVMQAGHEFTVALGPGDKGEVCTVAMTRDADHLSLTTRTGFALVPIAVQDLCAVAADLAGPAADTIVVTREDGSTLTLAAPASDTREKWHRGLRMASKFLYPAWAAKKGGARTH